MSSHIDDTAKAVAVFISSTEMDLVPYREAAAKAIGGLGFTVTQMETSGASSRAVVEKCLAQVESSLALVLIVAHRYGWVPSPVQGGDGRVSMTEMEVRKALSCNVDGSGKSAAPRSGKSAAPTRKDPAE